MQHVILAQGVAQCARRLREQWPRVDLAMLEELALELWRAGGDGMVGPFRDGSRGRTGDF
jgi:hypothetical protein